MIFNKQLNKLQLQDFGIVVLSVVEKLALVPVNSLYGVQVPKVFRQHQCSGYVLRLHLDAKSRLFWNFVFIVFLFWICSTSASFNLPVLSCTFISLHSANWINALSIFIVHYRFDNTNLPLLTISYFHWHQAASLTAPLPPPLHLASCVKS